MQSSWMRARGVQAVVVCAAAGAAAGSAQGSSPWATSVVAYDAGTTPVPGFTAGASALGSPERFTGEVDFGGAFASVVSPFNPAFGTDEVVSVGEGGHLTLQLGTPATDDPSHAFGVDLILFGNGGFNDGSDFPAGTVDAGFPLFGSDALRLEVSADGASWVDLGMVTEGVLPTMGYLDGGAYDSTPGAVAANFLKAADPTLEPADFAGLDLAGVRALYAGSGGGTGIDLAGSGLASVSFVRMSVADDGDAMTSLNFEIDAVAVVPGPGGVGVLAVMGACVRVRRRILV